MRIVRMLGVVLLAVGTVLAPFAAGPGGAVESSPAQRDAMQAFNDVAATAAQLDRLHADMMALHGKMATLYETLSAKVASVSKLAASSGVSSRRSSGSSTDLMQATQQMQQTQMSFNLQYLQLQEQMQNDSRQYTVLSNVLKSRYDTMKRILANMK